MANVSSYATTKTLNDAAEKMPSNVVAKMSTNAPVMASSYVTMKTLSNTTTKTSS